MRASLCVLSLLLAASASAQVEDGSALSAPAASDGTRPAETQPELGDVPPPPSEGYTAPRYAAPQTGRPSVRGDGDVRIPSRIATRLRVLDGSMQALAARGGNNVVDGILSLVSGGLVVGIAGWQWSEDKQLGGYLLLWGGANVARGLIDLTLTPNASRAAIAYAHMPMATMTEVEARLAFGERSLEELARRTRIARILDASLNIGVGAAVIPLYLAPNDFEIDDPFDYFVIIGSGISIISGLISLISRSDAERRWQAYRELRDRLVAEEEASLAPRQPRVRFMGAGASPLRGGAAVTSQWAF